MPELEIEGIGTIEIDESFNKLSPDQQNAFVRNVIGQVQGQQPTQPTLKQQPTQEQQPSIYDKALGFTQALAEGQPVKDIAGGAVSGLEDIGLGIYQAGADLGAEFQGAKKVLSLIRPDLAEEIQAFTPEDISEALGRRVTEKKAQEKDKGLVFKATKFVAETAPFLATGAGIKGAAAGGALIGALTPQEEGGLEERAKEAAIGGTVGAAAGTVLKGIGAGARGVKKLLTAKKPEDILAKRLPPEKTAELLEQLKTATPDSPVLLPDVAGDEIRGLTRAVGKLGNGRDIVTEALEGRSIKAVERVSNQLSKDISGVDTYFGSLDDIAKARSEMAAPLYKKAFEKGTTLDIGVKKGIQVRLGVTSPSLTLKQEQNRELINKVGSYIKSAKKDFGLGESIPNNSLTALDGAKKKLDDKISVAIRGGERQQAKVLLEIKNELLTELDRLNPYYKKARQVFSDFSSIQSAQEQGLQFSKLRPEELQRLFKTLSVSEKEAFRIGVRENLQKTVSSTSEGADPAKRIFGNSFKRNQIKAIFPNETKYKAFESRMKEEIAAAETKFKVLGGSRTDINLAGEAQFIDTVSKVGGGLALGSRFAVINALVSSFKNRFAGINAKNSKAIANILVKREKSIEALESILKKEKNATQKRILTQVITELRPALLAAKTTTQQREENK